MAADTLTPPPFLPDISTEPTRHIELATFPEIALRIGEASIRGSDSGGHEEDPDELPELHGHEALLGRARGEASGDGPTDGSPPTEGAGEEEPIARRFLWAIELNPTSILELDTMAAASNVPVGNVAITPERIRTGEQIADIYHEAAAIIRGANPLCEVKDAPNPDTGTRMEDAITYSAIDDRINLTVGVTAPDEPTAPAIGQIIEPPAQPHRFVQGDRLWIDARVPSGPPDKRIDAMIRLRFDHLPDGIIALTDLRTALTPASEQTSESDTVQAMYDIELLSSSLIQTRMILERVSVAFYKNLLRAREEEIDLPEDEPPAEGDETPES